MPYQILYTNCGARHAFARADPWVGRRIRDLGADSPFPPLPLRALSDFGEREFVSGQAEQRVEELTTPKNAPGAAGAPDDEAPF